MTNTHTEKDFKLFLSQLKETNATLDFFVDFEKVCNYSAPLTRKCQKSVLIISKLVLGLFPNSC